MRPDCRSRDAPSPSLLAALLFVRQAEAVTATTVPLVPSEPSIEPNELAILALSCQQAERLRFRYRDAAGLDSRRHACTWCRYGTGFSGVHSRISRQSPSAVRNGVLIRRYGPRKIPLIG